MAGHITTVMVDTETGGRVAIDFIHDTTTDVYTISIAGNAIDKSPEGVTASIQKAVIELATWRRSGLHR